MGSKPTNIEDEFFYDPRTGRVAGETLPNDPLSLDEFHALTRFKQAGGTERALMRLGLQALAKEGAK